MGLIEFAKLFFKDKHIPPKHPIELGNLTFNIFHPINQQQQLFNNMQQEALRAQAHYTPQAMNEKRNRYYTKDTQQNAPEFADNANIIEGECVRIEEIKQLENSHD